MKFVNHVRVDEQALLERKRAATEPVGSSDARHADGQDVHHE